MDQTVLKHFTIEVWTYRNVGPRDFGLTLVTLPGQAYTSKVE